MKTLTAVIAGMVFGVTLTIGSGSVLALHEDSPSSESQQLRERYGYQEDRGMGWRGPKDSERSQGSYWPHTPC